MMRQTKTVCTTVTVTVMLVAALLLFSCGRTETEVSQHEEEQMTEETGRAGHSEGHMHEAGEGETALAEESEDIPLSGTVSNGVRIIEMKARQFAFEPANIAVKRGEKIQLVVTSQDVMHGIGIPAFDIDVQLPPHEHVTVSFTPRKTGRYHFHCTVYCGIDHEKMEGQIIVREN